MTLDDRAAREAEYRDARPVAVRRCMRLACGTEVAHGYTTASQASELVRLLGVGRGDRVLDLGAGLGWPGIRVVRTTGCRLVSTDLASTAVAAVRRSFDDSGVDPSPLLSVADAAALPFRARTFEAVVHTDVLC